MTEAPTSDDPLQAVHDAEREVVDALARDYAARKAADPDFDGDVFFDDLRRLVEARALTLELVLEKGPMGGGGANEA